jgi:hypothetical protein
MGSKEKVERRDRRHPPLRLETWGARKLRPNDSPEGRKPDPPVVSRCHVSTPWEGPGPCICVSLCVENSVPLGTGILPLHENVALRSLKRDRKHEKPETSKMPWRMSKEKGASVPG